jgi:hypothetical protein
MRGISFVFVAEFDNQIIGSYSVSKMKVFISGKVEIAYYLADFKVHPDLRKSTSCSQMNKRSPTGTSVIKCQPSFYCSNSGK